VSQRRGIVRFLPCVALIGFVSLFRTGAGAQDRLRTMPGFDRYERIGQQIAGSVRGGSLTVTWSPDGRSFEYAREGKRYRYDVAALRAVEIGAAAEEAGRTGRGRQGGPERGRQYESAESPDKKFVAFYRARNLWLREVNGGNEIPVTSDGSETTRVKYATASWVYGEELGQRTAMWWSPDSRKLAYYRFDEKEVPDYFLQLDQTKLQSIIDTEAFPKAGAPNPVVDLFIYDVPTRKTTRVDVRAGRPFDNATVGHYVYRVQWSPDGRELLFNRTNRRQNVLELAAANPETGETRAVLREEWPTGWIENSPAMHFLDDGRRFVWESERNGWNNLYLRNLDGREIAPLTSHSSFEVSSIVKIDDKAGAIFYMARDGDNHIKTQLHRVGLDGRGDVRLTDPAFHHIVGACTPAEDPAPARQTYCGISPNNKYFVDVYQTHDTPPATRLADAADGRTVADLASSNVARFSELGLKKPELFTFKAADGATTLYGLLHFPSNFDPAKRYPVLVSVYGGPASASNTARETFVLPNAYTEFGFLVLNLDSRAAPGRGKRMLDSIYLKLGQVEIDDMAEGVKAVAARPYVDRSRVGIYGTSYGGYASAMSLLRHPEVYAAASASSPVTAWYHYDTIYTERYMWIPQENKAGYDAGSAMSYVKDLKGRLMIYYGTADNNVHPSNAMQLIEALQKAGKSFEVQVGPDRGHSSINPDRMMEFFIENLVLRPATESGATF
jgi:dipeptidyl-peptidase-4